MLCLGSVCTDNCYPWCVIYVCQCSAGMWCVLLLVTVVAAGDILEDAGDDAGTGVVRTSDGGRIGVTHPLINNISGWS